MNQAACTPSEDTVLANENQDKDGRTFTLNDFDGPLDVLLFLIKKNEVNIYDIPIGQITEQFLEYLDFAVTPALENLTDFYSMASDLLYIKSRMLLPVEISFGEEELEDPRQELVEKLNAAWAVFAENADKNVQGNKAAGTRARKASLELEKMMKEFRKASLEAAK